MEENRHACIYTKVQSTSHEHETTLGFTGKFYEGNGRHQWIK